MVKRIKNFFENKEHSYEDISRVYLLQNRLNKSVFFLLILIFAYTLNFFSLNLCYTHRIPFKSIDILIDIYTYFSLVIGLCVLPYHPRHYGFNLNRLKFNLTGGVLFGAAGLTIAILFRVDLYLHGEKEFQFYAYTVSFFKDFFIYPLKASAQEAVFKGFLQSYFIAIFEDLRYGKYIAIGISALVFAQFHIFYGGFPVFAGALIFAFLTGLFYEKSRSLVGISIIHFMTGAGLFFFIDVMR